MKHTEETKQKMGASMRRVWRRADRRVMCLDDGTIYEMATDAAAAAGVSPSVMSWHLSGRGLSAGGKKWAYVQDVKDIDRALAVQQ